MSADAAARLAQGRPAVANTQSYVSACRAVGYQHPDLTAHGAQILDWYGGQDGLDLQVLDADCTLLGAAADAAEEALRIELTGCGLVASAWEGGSGSRAADFADRHCVAGESVASALRAAAKACDALRDRLWQVVDAKVDAAVSIDDRRGGERPAWLTAAGIVTGGGADRAGAVEVVTGQITPYVDTDIRTEWVAAMRSAAASVATAFDDTVRRLTASPAAVFEVPGQLAAAPPAPPAPMAETPARMTVPSAVPAVAPSAPLPADDSALPPTLPETPPQAAAAPPPPPAAPSPPPAAMAEPPALGAVPSAGMPAMPTMPDVGGGLSGLAAQIADALDGLTGGGSDAPVDTPSPDAGTEDPAGSEDPTETEDPAETNDGPEPVTDEPDDAAPEAVPIGEPAASAAEPSELPASPPPAEEPEEAGSQTPCEIAADELPQVGQ
ncbi:hypothetical protein BayCH28_15610 [Mycolicibacterium sp. CH28]|uniref:hypothetical protein n=1 Tax=Mycolicibacterium sp. CH28 TaxID=2512237 RepID=UPI0010807876|nr:hypothetical protein [Mycolicibacterium sp. CH28]TGD86683.1 hypothetical protein BayCH28_15610 [Mycolicibacterium sp. CH28]